MKARNETGCSNARRNPSDVSRAQQLTLLPNTFSALQALRVCSISFLIRSSAASMSFAFSSSAKAAA